MPSLLTRSKSLRLLKGGRRGMQQEETQNHNSVPHPNTFTTDFDRFKAATPVPRAGGTLEAPEMVTRPSTSGGPGERAIQFHKKTLPAPSIYSEDRFLAFSSPTNSSAALHAVDSPGDVIGIALGSPTIGSHWTSTPQATTENLIADAQMSLQSHTNASTTTITGPQALPKPKVSRWKSLFKKTAPPPREKPAFYQLAQQVPPARADSHHDTSPKSKSRPKLKTEGGVTLPVSVYNPDVATFNHKSHENVSTVEVQHGRKRSATLDAGRSAPRYRFQRSATTPNPPQASSEAPDMKFLQDTPARSAQNLAGSGLLDVDIPDTKLDRYSVMFSGVLEPTPNRSSLYQRRQEKADQEKLKSLDNILVKDDKESLPESTIPRRAPSPTMSNPPSARLSLFPATGRATPTLRAGTPTLRAGTPTLRAGTPVLKAPSPLVSNSPRARSKTAPARSPTQQTFKTAEDSKSKPPSTSITRQYNESPKLNPHQSALTPTSICSFDSSDNESITIVVGRTTPAEAKAWKAHVESQEPEWEILPKPRSASASADRSTSVHRSLSRKQPRVTAASALSSHPANTPLEVSSPLQNLQMLLSPPLSAEPFKQPSVEQPVIRRTASQRKAQVVGGNAQTATVGIARSVSVSKASRPRTLVRTQTYLAGDTREHEKKFGDGMALTPMLVEIGHRKSQRVQLVDA